MFSFCISFSDITIRFVLPESVELPPAFEALRCDDKAEADVEYEICLLKAPLLPDGECVGEHSGMRIYRTEDGILRIYTGLIADDGCQIACLLNRSGHHKLYYPAASWDFYSEPLNCSHLISGEILLIMFEAFLLHSSVVKINGKAVLFSGPSGMGKSTQANLWAEYLGAEILNGDRCVVMKKADGFYGGGSVWAGTSGIYRPEQAPIAGIFLLGQAKENHVHKLGIEALKPLFSQSTVNSWDSEFMEKILQLYAELLDTVPVYRLDCRPDREAVELAYHTLF